jgi:hypothetical protein
MPYWLLRIWAGIKLRLAFASGNSCSLHQGCAVTTSACPLPPCQVPTHKRQIEVVHPPMCSVLRVTLLLNWRVQPKQLCFQPRSNLHQIDITTYSFINSTFAHSLPTWRSQWRLLSPMVRANTDLEVLRLNRVIQVRNFAPVLALAHPLLRGYGK